MVFHHLNKRRAAVGPGIYYTGACPGADVASVGSVLSLGLLSAPPWVWNGKIFKKFLFSLQFIQQK